MVDRRIASDNFTTFVTASDALMGRLFAQWIVEKLHGMGNIVILGGQAVLSSNHNRVGPAMQVFKQYPDIKILDTVYSHWSPVKGKEATQAVIAKYLVIRSMRSSLRMGCKYRARSKPSWKPAGSRTRFPCTSRRT